jgi:hypothetical protein
LGWTVTWKVSWPHTDQESAEYFGLSRDAEREVADCPEPPLATCESDEECQAVRVDLVCLHPSDSAPGVCEEKGKCYNHEHCLWPTMCSCEGTCVEPRVYVRNKMNTAVNVQLFARSRSSSPVDTYSMSAHEQVHDFAQTHGLCQFRNWFEYRQLIANGTRDGLLMRLDLERISPRTDNGDSFTLKERGVLKMRPHPCDWSYQHTDLGVCTQQDFNGWVSPSASVDPGEPLGGGRTRMRSMRTWHRG